MSSFKVKFKQFRRAIKFVLYLPIRLPINAIFFLRHRALYKQPKIIYGITPPPRLKNIGDHAQSVAIHTWIKKHYPGMPVLEVDKDQARYYLPALRFLIQPRDIIYLHSGGNLGDRGLWSENIRRLMIATFAKNKIVSLPQTIFFSDTERGRTERERSIKLYARHPDLTVIGRDLESGELASELFPKARTFAMPDFVLSLAPFAKKKKADPPKLLLCLRNDDESILSEAQKRELHDVLKWETDTFDTTLDNPISVERRADILTETLEYFHSFDAVITDRFHGLIFSVITKKPCLVLRTVDHKLTSALYWFGEVPFVFPVESYEKVAEMVETALACDTLDAPDWNEKYFDRIPGMVSE